MDVLKSTRFQFDSTQQLYQGKVRDVYRVANKIVLVATDRISAFDHILYEAIPLKGQVLNQISAFFLQETQQVVPNWFEHSPDPNVSVGKACVPIRLEMVVRGYLSGHAWRMYRSGERTICGVRMPEGLKENDPFPKPIITPSVKAEEGHDEDISREEILEKKIIDPASYALMEDYSLRLFRFGSELALERGLILVDTKYEFGIYENEIMLIDEVHTPDSSRYFYLEGYEERQRSGAHQKQLSKEFVREWLIANGFQGKEGQILPHLPETFVREISNRYIELYEKITGLQFVPQQTTSIEARIEQNVKACLKRGC